jgi:hypothetical protein
MKVKLSKGRQKAASKAPVAKRLATLEEAARVHPYQLDQLVGYTITEIQETEDESPVLVCSMRGRPDLFAIVLGDEEGIYPGFVEINVDRQHTGRTFADVAVGETCYLALDIGRTRQVWLKISDGEIATSSDPNGISIPCESTAEVFP